MVDGDDPGDATAYKPDDEVPLQGLLPPKCGDVNDVLLGHVSRDRYTWSPVKDKHNVAFVPYTGWKFPIYDNALGKVVAVCCEQHIAIQLCNWMSSYDIEH